MTDCAIPAESDGIDEKRELLQVTFATDRKSAKDVRDMFKDMCDLYAPKVLRDPDDAAMGKRYQFAKEMATHIETLMALYPPIDAI